MASRNELSDLISGKLEDFEKTITDFVDDWAPAESGRWDPPAFLAAVAAADFIGAMKFRGARRPRHDAGDDAPAPTIVRGIVHL